MKRYPHLTEGETDAEGESEAPHWGAAGCRSPCPAALPAAGNPTPASGRFPGAPRLLPATLQPGGRKADKGQRDGAPHGVTRASAALTVVSDAATR